LGAGVLMAIAMLAENNDCCISTNLGFTYSSIQNFMPTRSAAAELFAVATWHGTHKLRRAGGVAMLH